MEIQSRFLPLATALVLSAPCVAAGLQIECDESAPEKRAAAELKKYITLLAEEEPDLKFRIFGDRPRETSHLCALSALASLGLVASPWVAPTLKGRLRVSA